MSMPTTETRETPTPTPKIIGTLNTCIEACIDGEKGYALAAVNVRDEMLKTLFHKYAQQREEFVRALQGAIGKLGGYAENEGSTKGALHRGFAGARVALEGGTDEVVLCECERGEHDALAVYDRALASPLLDAMPADVRTMLAEQRAAIAAAYDDITHEDLRRRLTHR